MKGVCIGAGYFGQFHYEAWSRIPEVTVSAVCDLNREKAEAVAQKYAIPGVYTDLEKMLRQERPDFIDIITPPPTHLPIVQAAAAAGVHVICQKPLAPTYNKARALVETASGAGIRLMVHENFRFQPWHREIKKLIERGELGDRLFTLYFRCRQGDGWGEDAYLGRQPYFRTMPRLLLHETGIHFIDTFRYLAGEVRRVHAVMRKLNPVIGGEDYALLIFEFESGAVGQWDANRYNEADTDNPRYTFGQFWLEGSGGMARLEADGRLFLKKLGKPEREHLYSPSRLNFAGDCVYHTQRHFIDALRHDKPFETSGDFYLENIRIEEALYVSAETGQSVEMRNFSPHGGAGHAVV